MKTPCNIVVVEECLVQSFICQMVGHSPPVVLLLGRTTSLAPASPNLSLDLILFLFMLAPISLSRMAPYSQSRNNDP